MQIENFLDEFGPEKILEVYDAKTGMRGVTIIDNTALGPGKGGIRMTSTVDIAEVFRLARTMTWKCSIAGLPFGGAKSGIKASPRTLEEKKAVIQAFSKSIKPICPKHYIAAPDINTAEQEMKWFVEANGSWKAATGKPSSLCVKPGEKCGIPHEYGSTGLGVAYSTLAAVKHCNLDIKNLAVAIEGFGNVGTFAARHLSEFGARIVAVSDSKGVVYSQEGLDVKKLLDVKATTGSVINYMPGKALPNKEIFELGVDIIIPSALPDVINKDNAGRVKSKIIVEAANIPMTPEIEQKFHEKGVLVVPDFVANAGGVISSYAEYRGYNPKDMFNMVQKKITKNTKHILSKAKKEKTSPRDAAMEIAVERVRKAMAKRK